MSGRALSPFLVLLLLVSGCSSTVKLTGAIDGVTPRSVALLPIEIPAGVAPDRVNTLRDAFSAELRNSGFTLLDDAIIERICGTPACPRAGELASEYFVDGFFTVQLASISRNDFLAGYYNAIRGSLTLRNRDGKEIIKAEKTESERGGLLFNSGQLLQGILSQIKNAEARSFERLADSFASALVSRIPSPVHGVPEPEGAAVAISNIDIDTSRSGVERICARGTPHSMAFVFLSGRKTNLREVSPGNYCARLRLEDFPSALSALTVEVRSPYGSSARRSISSAAPQCDIRGLVRVQPSRKGKRLIVACARTRSRPTPLGENCDEHLQDCADYRFLIYQSQSLAGPFKKVAEITDVAWNLPSARASGVYQVVAVDEHGGSSAPVAALDSSEGAAIK